MLFECGSETNFDFGQNVRKYVSVTSPLRIWKKDKKSNAFFEMNFSRIRIRYGSETHFRFGQNVRRSESVTGPYTKSVTDPKLISVSDKMYEEASPLRIRIWSPLRVRYGSQKGQKKQCVFLRGISHEYGFVTDLKRISDSDKMYEEASALRIRNGSEWQHWDAFKKSWSQMS